MHFKNEDDFAKDFKTRGLQGLYLLYAADSYLIEAWRSRILSRFGGDEGFNLQRLDGRRPDLDALYDATQMLPLFADSKCVLMDDLEPARLNADDQKKLIEIFAELPGECVLLITARAPVFDPKGAVGKKLLAEAAKHGCAIELGLRGASDLVKFLQRCAGRYKCELPANLCREILRVCPNDMSTLALEVGKVCAYAGGESITQQHLDVVLTVKTEARVFDLSKAILAGNAQRSMEILADLFYLREAPIAILATLIMAYVDLYRARIAKDQGVPATELSARLGYKGREFRINNAYNTRISLAALRKSLELLAGCDRAMKSTGANDQALLEKTTIALIAARGLA